MVSSDTKRSYEEELVLNEAGGIGDGMEVDVVHEIKTDTLISWPYIALPYVESHPLLLPGNDGPSSRFPRSD